MLRLVRIRGSVHRAGLCARSGSPAAAVGPRRSASLDQTLVWPGLLIVLHELAGTYSSGDDPRSKGDPGTRVAPCCPDPPLGERIRHWGLHW